MAARRESLVMWIGYHGSREITGDPLDFRSPASFLNIPIAATDRISLMQKVQKFQNCLGPIRLKSHSIRIK